MSPVTENGAAAGRLGPLELGPGGLGGQILAQPMAASVYCDLATALAQGGKADAAMRALAIAQVLDGSDQAQGVAGARLWDGRTEVLAALGNYEGAIAAALEAIARDGDNLGRYQRLFKWACGAGAAIDARYFNNFSLSPERLAQFCQVVGYGDGLEPGPIAAHYTLPDGGLWHDSDRFCSAVWAAGDRLVPALSAGNVAAGLGRRWRDRPTPERLRGRIGLGVALWSERNYYHWMIDALPRLLRLRDGAGDWGSFDGFVVSDLGQPFQEETLALLGIPRDRVYPSRQRYFQVDQLVAVPPIGMTADSCQRLRAALRGPALAAASGTGPARLFLRRGQTNQRRLANEEAVIAALEPLGFVAVTLDRLSVAEQIRLLAGARSVIAPHGAALTNTIFCEPGTKILELFASAYRDTNFAAIAQHLDLTYHRRVVMVPEDTPPNGDYWIDGAALAAIAADLDL